jgi:hypothetical protein
MKEFSAYSSHKEYPIDVHRDTVWKYSLLWYYNTYKIYISIFLSYLW